MYEISNAAIQIDVYILSQNATVRESIGNGAEEQVDRVKIT